MYDAVLDSFISLLYQFCELQTDLPSIKSLDFFVASRFWFFFNISSATIKIMTPNSI